jgi:tRNA modification GTPase
MSDTIVAHASARGIAALALVRVSGPAADSILTALLPEGSELPEPRRTSLRRLTHPVTGEMLDHAVVVRYAGPRSYTGEDMLEITCHGGALTPDLVLDACLAAGARPAEPGEFTKRAYLNGKMDLVQVEAVADLIEGASPGLRKAALLQVEGGLSERISSLRAGIIALEAQLVHHLDFPEEDDAPIPLEEIAAGADDLVVRLNRLLESAPGGTLLRDGALAVLAGRPNAGKSSLFNALLGEERAIVTSEPGTTRDAVDSVMSVEGFPFRLVDTAGVREPGGVVEELGIEIARRFMDQAEFVLYCLEASRLLDDEERSFLGQIGEDRVILVRTRCDEIVEGVGGVPFEGGFPVPEIRTSVRTGEGLRALRQAMIQKVYSAVRRAVDSESPVVTRERQARCIRSAREELDAFSRGVREGLPGEVASAHLKTAESCLEEVVGVIGGEEVLDVVFRDFCIGK